MVQGQRPKTAQAESAPLLRLIRRLEPPLFFPFLNFAVILDTHSLRQQLQCQRQALSDAEQRQAAFLVTQRILNWPVYQAALRVASYWPCRGELDPLPILEHAWNMGKMVYLPIMVNDPPQSLQFAPYQLGVPLQRNRFNIPEPDSPITEWLAPQQLDLVITPLVAFDLAGTRLGMGGGFYDRSFNFLLNDDHTPQRPYLLGLGYEFQKTADLLVREAWDVPLDAAVTEVSFYEFARLNGIKER